MRVKALLMTGSTVYFFVMISSTAR